MNWVDGNLKDGEERLPERVEVGSRLVSRSGEVEPSAEQLHSEQGEDDDEEEEQQQEAGDGPDRVEQ